MGIFSLFIVNKSGGLIYQQDFDGRARLDANEYLRMGSAFHAFYVITSQLSPIGTSSGIQTIEGDTFTLHCFQSPTGYN